MKPSPRMPYILFLLPLIIILPVVGFLVSRQITIESDEGTFAKWNSLGKPPVKTLGVYSIGRVGQDHDFEVFIRSSDTGMEYVNSTADQIGWRVANLVESDYRANDINCFDIPAGALKTLIHSQSSANRQCNIIRWTWEFVSDITYIVMLDNGSIWWWHHYQGFDTIVLGLCSGPLVGIILAFLASWSLWKRKKQGRNNQSL